MDYIGRALVSEALQEWREQLATSATVSPLRDLVSAGADVVDLRGAHPAGIAPLFAGRPTLISALIRDEAPQAAALHRIGLIYRQATQVKAASGVWTAAMSVGTATWTQDGARREVPVLLRPMLVEAFNDRDFYLTLLDGVTLNPIVATELRTRGDTASLADLVPPPGAGKAFDPRPIWNALRERGTLFGEDFAVVENLLVGAYDDPEQRLLDDLDDCDAVIGASDILAAVAGDQDAAQLLASPLPAFPKGDRDPFAERGIGDLDDNQFAALDVIATGRSVFLQAPPGADALSMAAAVAADAAASGKVVAVVSGSDGAVAGVGRCLDDLGAGDLYIDGHSRTWNAEARARLLSAITLGAVDVDDAQLREGGEAMLRARHGLQQRFDSLHRPHRPWGVSAFEAVQAVVRLTSSDPSPGTAVRLGADAGAIVADHGFASVAAELVAHLGETAAAENRAAQEPEADDAAETSVPAEDLVPWWSATTDDAEVGAKYDEALATILVRQIPKMRTEAALAAHETGVDQAPSLAVWADQVTMFDDIRATLDVFSPAVFHRSLHDLVAATAPSSSPRYQDVPRRDRRGMVRRAVELLRPGRGKENLHENLVNAHEQALKWRAHSPSGGWPVVPDDFDIFSERLHNSAELWGLIVEAVEQASGEEKLAEQPWDHMVSVLSRLAEGIPGSLDAVEAVPIEADIEAVGFAELLADLHDRGAGPEQVRRDLEFSWWAAAFDSIVAADVRLTETGALGKAVDAFLDRDTAFGASRVGPLMRAVAERRRTAIARHPHYARDLFAALVEGGDGSLKELWRDYAPLVTALRPVVIAGAEQVARMAPASRCIDLAVIVAGESLALAELVSTLARARQVVVLGDAQTATRSGVAALARLLPHIVMHAVPQPRDPRVTAVLASAAYGRSLSALPAAEERGGLAVTVLDAVGAPVAGAVEVESTRAEVTAVVDHVARVRASLPRRALAVVAGNDLHGSRIVDALRERDARLANVVHVMNLGDSAGVVADEVVVSLGYAADARGVAPAKLGALSETWGRQALVQALVVSTERVSVFTALNPTQLSGAASRAQEGHGIDDLRDLMSSVDLPVVTPERPDPGPSDWLLADIAGRLRRHGLAVRLRYGVGSDTIAMVVGGRHDRTYQVAVVTDEAAAVGAASLRDRMRWQYSTLEALGWKVVSLWTLDVFMDPDSAIEQVLDALGESRPEDGPGGTAAIGTAAIPTVGAGTVREVTQPALDIEVERVELPPEHDALDAAREDGNDFAIADLRVEDSGFGSHDAADAVAGTGDDPHPQTLGISALIDEQIGGEPAVPESVGSEAVAVDAERPADAPQFAKVADTAEVERVDEENVVGQQHDAVDGDDAVDDQSADAEELSDDLADDGSDEEIVVPELAPDSGPTPLPSFSMGFGVPKLAAPVVSMETSAADVSTVGTDASRDASDTDGGEADNTMADAEDATGESVEHASAETEDEVAAPKPKAPEPDVKARHRGADRPLIPTRAWEDVDEAWGGSHGGSSRDEEIKRDKPPHW